MKIAQFINILGFTIIASSCSSLDKVGVLVPTDIKNKKACATCYKYETLIFLKTKAYDYSSDSLSLTICPSPKPGIPVLIGPPVVPVIPNVFLPFQLLFFQPKDKFYIDFKISSKLTEIEIDFNKINFYVNGDTLKKIKIIKIEEINFGLSNKYWYSQDRLQENTKVILSNKPLYLRFLFDINNMKVKKLEIKYEDNNLKIPIIQFKNKCRLGYQPMINIS